MRSSKRPNQITAHNAGCTLSSASRAASFGPACVSSGVRRLVKFMRPLAYIIVVILGVLCFGIHWFTGSFLCFIGALFLLYSVWCLICAARPKFREPNVKFPGGDTVRGCVEWAFWSLVIGVIICMVGFEFRI